MVSWLKLGGKTIDLVFADADNFEEEWVVWVGIFQNDVPITLAHNLPGLGVDSE